MRAFPTTGKASPAATKYDLAGELQLLATSSAPSPETCGLYIICSIHSPWRCRRWRWRLRAWWRRWGRRRWWRRLAILLACVSLWLRNGSWGRCGPLVVWAGGRPYVAGGQLVWRGALEAMLVPLRHAHPDAHHPLMQSTCAILVAAALAFFAVRVRGLLAARVDDGRVVHVMVRWDEAGQRVAATTGAERFKMTAHRCRRGDGLRSHKQRCHRVRGELARGCHATAEPAGLSGIGFVPPRRALLKKEY